MSTTRTVALALLSLLLTAATPASTPQAPPPVPGEVAVQNAQRSDGKEGATATEQPSATQAPTVTPTAEPTKETSPSGAVAGKDEQEAQPIRVAPVDVHLDSVDVKKDWADYVALFFTAALIGISAIQIYYLRETLRETGIAADAAHVAANVARDALRAEHRPRIAISENPSIYVQHGGYTHRRFRFALRNFGKTPAVNFRACLFYDAVSTPSLEDAPEYRDFVASDLAKAPTNKLAMWAAALPSESGLAFDRPLESEGTVLQAADGKVRLFAGIKVLYWDSFDPPQRYEEKFVFLNEPGGMTLIPQVAGGNDRDEQR